MFGALEDFVAEVLAGRTHHGLMPAHPVPAALDAHEGVAHAVQRAGNLFSFVFADAPVSDYAGAKAQDAWRYAPFFLGLVLKTRRSVA